MSSFMLEDQLINDITSKLSLGSQSQFTNNVETDDDISMPDYTEDESEIVPETNHFKDNQRGYIEDQEETEKINDRKYTVSDILSPESQGYALSRAINGRNDTMEERVTSETPMKFQDKNIIIHNHFYNINGDGITRRFNKQIAFKDKEYIEDGNYSEDELVSHEEGNFAKELDNHNGHLMLFEQIKRSINYSILLIIGYHVLKTIREDFQIEFDKMNVRLQFQRDQCYQEYQINKCSEYGQLPGLKEECLEWEICFNNGKSNQFKSMIFIELIFQVVSRVVDDTLNNIGSMNKIYLLGCMVIWYFGNFVCGYLKGASK